MSEQIEYLLAKDDYRSWSAQEIQTLQQEIRRLHVNVGRLLRDWERAYIEEMFPAPPEQPEKGAKLVWVSEEGEVLSDPFAIDQVSALMGRHMTKSLRRAYESDGE